MVFWIISAIVMAIGTLTALVPLWRSGNDSVDPVDYDKEIYAARIEEIDRDYDIGRLSAEEKAAAKAEEGRRLIQLSKDSGEKRHDSPGVNKAIYTAMIVIFLPLATLGLYFYSGSPGKPDLPLAERQNDNPQIAALENLLGKAEAQLAKNPEDGRGWRVVAPVYLRFGRIDDAINAYRNSIRLNDYDQEEVTSLAEALVVKNQGVINSDAVELFKQANEKIPEDPKPRFFLAIALGQEGKAEEAAEAWRDLLKDAPENANWKQVAIAQLNEQLEKLGQPQEEGEQSAELGGPSKEDVENAEQMSPEDRQAMIEGMVASLSERLAENPNNMAGWRRLIRSFLVLNRLEDAQEAIDSAKTAITENDEFEQFLVQSQEIIDSRK